MANFYLVQYRALAAVIAFTASLFGAVSLSAQSIDDITLNVYKDINCGCCVGWIDHMQDKGFASKINHPRDLNGVKHELGVLPEWQSCHTAVTKEDMSLRGMYPLNLSNNSWLHRRRAHWDLQCPECP